MSEPVHFYRWKEQRDWTPPVYVVEVTRKDGMRHTHKFYYPDEAHSFARMKAFAHAGLRRQAYSSFL